MGEDKRMRLIDADQLMKKMPMDVGAYMVNEAPTVRAIPIPEGATVGDTIKAMFPDCEQKEHINNNGYFEMYFDNDLRNASYMRVNKEFWNAPYRVEGETEE